MPVLTSFVRAVSLDCIRLDNSLIGRVFFPRKPTPYPPSPSPTISQTFARPAEVVAPDLIGCLLVKHQEGGELLWGVAVETEAYSLDNPAYYGYRRRSPSNETLFGEPGRIYVYVSYGIHHCVKRALTSRSSGWA